MYYTHRSFLLILLLASLWLLPFPTGLVLADTLTEAGVAFARGDYPSVISLTSGVLTEHNKARSDRIKALIRRAEAYRALGYLPEAHRDFETALQEAHAQDQHLLELVATQALGQVLYQQQNLEQAKIQLRAAVEQAQALDQSELLAAGLVALGNIELERDHKQNAITHFERALTLTAPPEVHASARLNLAKLATDPAVAEKYLHQALQDTQQIAEPADRTTLLLTLADQAKTSDSALAERVLCEALAIAEDLQHPRLLSQAHGQLGALYEAQGSYPSALTHTEQAILSAQGAQDLLLDWQWQLGRLRVAQGQRMAAIGAYRRAVAHIQAIRQDIPVTYAGGHSSFRETLSPIYLSLADLLLQQSAQETVNSPEEQALLAEARDTVERIKVSELHDYFQDTCIVAHSESLQGLEPHTAVLYPIILPNRLELILSIGNHLTRKSVTVPKGDLEQAGRLLISTLRDGHVSFKETARPLYDWLIQPVRAVLDKADIDTLVFVPDGVLRLFPIAALWDGTQFLVERYAIVTAPGLTLLDPTPLPRTDVQALLAGLSLPGPVVYELPEEIWRNLAGSAIPNNRGLVRGRTLNVETLRAAVAFPPVPPPDPRAGDVQQALALPGVKDEIDQLAKHLPGQVLINQTFAYDRFVSEIARQPYQIVHIASHGFFGGAPEQNFVMTYDRRLDMNSLARLLQPKRLATLPIEMLTLSACQTAEGDDRSPLGLTGIALKSGARSVLGSLWPVSDDATKLLLPDFYTRLVQPQTSKAQALRQAQLDLLRQKDFQHPFFWSPFILVGNWL